MLDASAQLQLSPIIMALGLAALSLLPFLFVIGTCFAKFSLVLTLLRSALGTQNAPSGMILNGLAMILSLVVMGPTLSSMWERANQFASDHVPIEEEAEGSAVDSHVPRAETNDDAVATDDRTTTTSENQPDVASGIANIERWNSADWFLAAEYSIEPWREFLALNSGETELAFFYEIYDRQPPEYVENTSIASALPAFLLTELAEAFQIGFLLFLPFLLVDLLVGSVLLALGMHMLTPTTVSLPFKLLLFVLVQGWILISENLILSYTTVGGL